MELRKAISLVLNEAETSALGDSNSKVLDSVTLLHDFFDWVADDVKVWDKYMADEYRMDSFIEDKERMSDFHELSKAEFLKKYPFTTEEEYNITRIEDKNLTD